MEHHLYPKYLRGFGAIILVLCHLTFLSTSARPVPFHLVFCMQFLLCSSPFCYVCLPQRRQSGSAKSQPQPYLSIPLDLVVVVAFGTKSLSYTSVCKAQCGRFPSSVCMPSRASFSCNELVSLDSELDPDVRPSH